MSRQLTKDITADKNVRFGKPVIESTRVPVDLVVGKIAGGMETKEVMEEYGLTKKQVLAALEYAAEVVSQERIALV